MLFENLELFRCGILYREIELGVAAETEREVMSCSLDIAIMQYLQDSRKNKLTLTGIYQFRCCAINNEPFVKQRDYYYEFNFEDNPFEKRVFVIARIKEAALTKLTAENILNIREAHVIASTHADALRIYRAVRPHSLIPESFMAIDPDGGWAATKFVCDHGYDNLPQRLH